MKFPSADRYSEAVQNPSVYFTDTEIKRRRVQTDALGLPEVLSGGFAFTYRFCGSGGDIAVRCFHREIPELFERYRSIASFLASARSRFFVDFSFSEQGVRVDGSALPVVRMEWVEGETLLGYVARRRSDPAALDRLREQLLAFAEEAERLGFAHGDVQHRNLLITPSGVLKLVDYDGMYVPALRHLKAADGGHPHFQPPSRSMGDFGPRMDRFPLAVIDFSLEALRELPNLFDQFHRGENLILSRDDFISPSSSPVLNAIVRSPKLAPRVAAFSDLCRLSAREAPSLGEFRAGVVGGASVVSSSLNNSLRHIYTSPFDVVDGMNYRAAVRFVGRPIELVGQVLQVKPLTEKRIVLLRFGTKYAETPTVVMSNNQFSRINSFFNGGQSIWVAVTGVLQTHRSGQYASVQIFVKEASDVEILPSKHEADFRLGRVSREASVPAASPPGAATSAQTIVPSGGSPSTSASGPNQWSKARGSQSGDPDWMTSGRQRLPGTPAPTPVAAGITGSGSAASASPRAAVIGSRRLLCPNCKEVELVPPNVSYFRCRQCGTGSQTAKWQPEMVGAHAPSGPPKTAAVSSSTNSSLPSIAPVAMSAVFILFLAWLLSQG